MNNSGNVIVVLGPTASGKSDFAVELAKKHNGEIISADSRQVYRGLDIGTGKITEAEMKGIPHHMLSVYELDEEISVARYARDATPILHDILSHGKTPIICGGTGQYIDALIYQTAIPKVTANKIFREELEKKSTEELFEELMRKDQSRALAIDKHNKVRIIRALEIIETLGHVPELPPQTLLYETAIYHLVPTRELLRERITLRLTKRLQEGMIQEVKTVMQKGYDAASMKRLGLEYAIIGEYLEGTISEEVMKEKIITKSMQYAKRQETWNKKYSHIEIKVDITK